MTTGMLINGRKREDLLAKRLKEVAAKRERDSDESARASKKARPGNSSKSNPPKARSRPPLPIVGPNTDDLVFDKLSELGINLSEGVNQTKRFVNGLDYVLWSAREAAYLRVRSDEPQLSQFLFTRTAAIYFFEGNKGYVAFDDSSKESENIILSAAEIGYQNFWESKNWIVPTDDPQIQGALKRAEADHRIVKIHPSVYEHFFATGNPGRYGTASINQALLGPDVARSYSNWLCNRKLRSRCNARTLTENHLRSYNLDPASVLVHAVGLESSHSYGLTACGIYRGIACGAALKTSFSLGGTPP